MEDAELLKLEHKREKRVLEKRRQERSKRKNAYARKAKHNKNANQKREREDDNEEEDNDNENDDADDIDGSADIVRYSRKPKVDVEQLEEDFDEKERILKNKAQKKAAKKSSHKKPKLEEDEDQNEDGDTTTENFTSNKTAKNDDSIDEQNDEAKQEEHSNSDAKPLPSAPENESQLPKMKPRGLDGREESDAKPNSSDTNSDSTSESSNYKKDPSESHLRQFGSSANAVPTGSDKPSDKKESTEKHAAGVIGDGQLNLAEKKVKSTTSEDTDILNIAVENKDPDAWYESRYSGDDAGKLEESLVQKKEKNTVSMKNHHDLAPGVMKRDVKANGEIALVQKKEKKPKKEKMQQKKSAKEEEAEEEEENDDENDDEDNDEDDDDDE